MDNIVRQELHCHNCNCYVQFDVDLNFNGNHVLICPKCEHEHCRVVENGVITNDRWDRRNETNVVSTCTVTYSFTSTMSNYYNVNSASLTSTTYNVDQLQFFTYKSWLNTTSNK